MQIPMGGAERPRVVPLAQHAAWQANRCGGRQPVTTRLTRSSTTSRKDFVISTPLTDQEVTGDDFLDLVLHRLRATAPFVQFLSNAVGLA